MQTEIVLNASGTDGSAGVSVPTETILRGFIEWLLVKYTNAPATTVLSVALNDPMGVAPVVYTSVASASGGLFFPRAAAINGAGAAITNSFAKIYIPGWSLTLALATANHNTIAQVIIALGESWLEP